MQRAGSSEAGLYLTTSVPPNCPLGVTMWAGGSLAPDKRGGVGVTTLCKRVERRADAPCWKGSGVQGDGETRARAEAPCWQPLGRTKVLVIDKGDTGQASHDRLLSPISTVH